MPNPIRAVQSYLTIDRQRYDGLIQRLVEEVKNQNTEFPDVNEAALKEYFAVALTKGADFSVISFSDLAGMSSQALEEAANALPDKLTLESREQFAEAGEARPAPMRWNKLFQNNKDEIVLELAENAQSVNDRIASYIEQHNTQATANYQQALIVNPQTAGRSIDQQQIRRDPQNTSLLQVLNPARPVNEDGSERWLPGQRLGAFFEQRMEWALLDDFQLDNSRRQSVIDGTIGQEFDLREMLDRQVRDDTNPPEMTDISADHYDPASLMIVISRDPQKIGEMSSRQHWDSCMNEIGGVNFHYVPKDIEAGTLVAYLVSKDDPDARYPLMRQLLKPYYSHQTGEIALVPAKIYGADTGGNSRSRQALHDTLTEFARQNVNAGKSGEFFMDSRLYGDGQPGLVNLQAVWTQETIKKGLTRYYESSLQEWLTELNSRENQIALSDKENAQDYEKLEREIKGFKTKIKNLTNPELLAKGFFRETRKASPDSLPEPQEILLATQSPEILNRAKAINALVLEGDGTLLVQYFEEQNSPLAERVGIVGKITDFSSMSEHNYASSAVNLWTKYTTSLPTVEERIEEAMTYTLRFGTPQIMQDAAIQILLDSVGKLGKAEERYKLASFLERKTEQENNVALAGLIAQDIQSLPVAGEKIEAATIVLKILPNNFVGTDIIAQALEASYTSINASPYAKEKIDFSLRLLKFAENNQSLVSSEAIEHAQNGLVQAIPQHYSIYLRNNSLDATFAQIKELECYKNNPSFREKIDNVIEVSSEITAQVKYLGDAATLPVAEQQASVSKWVEWVNHTDDPETKLAAVMKANQIIKRGKLALMAADGENSVPIEAIFSKIIVDLAPKLPSVLQQTEALFNATILATDSETKDRLESQFAAAVSADKSTIWPEYYISWIQQLETRDKVIDLERPSLQKLTELTVEYAARARYNIVDRMAADTEITYLARAAFKTKPGSDFEHLAATKFRSCLEQLPGEERRVVANNILQMIVNMRNDPTILSQEKHGSLVIEQAKAVLEGQPYKPIAKTTEQELSKHGECIVAKCRALNEQLADISSRNPDIEVRMQLANLPKCLPASIKAVVPTRQ